jgi:hypothetical protein
LTEVLEGFQVAGGAAIGCGEGKAGRVGKDAGEDVTKCEEVGESAGSIDSKNHSHRQCAFCSSWCRPCQHYH